MPCLIRFQQFNPKKVDFSGSLTTLQLYLLSLMIPEGAWYLAELNIKRHSPSDYEVYELRYRTVFALCMIPFAQRQIMLF